MTSFLAACDNLIGCFRGDLTFEDARRGRRYVLAEEGRSKPIKRIPGLALPDGSHLLDGSPLPLHLYDFAQHIFHNHARPEALVFYIPKLETAEEAAYVRKMIASAESRVLSMLAPSVSAPDRARFVPGTVKVFVVFENPRAIFRIRDTKS